MLNIDNSVSRLNTGAIKVFIRRASKLLKLSNSLSLSNTALIVHGAYIDKQVIELLRRTLTSL